jgi:hypothetical protein
MAIRISGQSAVLFSLLLIGCARQHHMDWETGMSAWGESELLDSDSVMFHTVSWENLLAEPTRHFPFSVRMPDGTMLLPGQFTLEKLDAHGAEEINNERGAGRRIHFPNGWITAYFDAKQGLELVGVSFRIHREEESEGDCQVAVGDATGDNVICLPTKRADLVDLFGEPKREYSYIPGT